MTQATRDSTTSAAEISPCGLYRYTLTREWDDGRCVGFVMFNPSTADASQDDATIRKCVGFAKRWGYGRMVVVNLYAIRARDPKRVKLTQGRVGPLNDYWIAQAASESREMICAWGCSSHMPDDGRIVKVINILKQRGNPFEINCLGKGKDGQPRHPLMLPYSTARETFASLES